MNRTLNFLKKLNLTTYNYGNTLIIVSVVSYSQTTEIFLVSNLGNAK